MGYMGNPRSILQLFCEFKTVLKQKVHSKKWYSENNSNKWTLPHARVRELNSG